MEETTQILHNVNQFMTSTSLTLNFKLIVSIFRKGTCVIRKMYLHNGMCNVYLFMKSYFRSVHFERLYSCWGHYWFCKMLAGVWRSCTRRWFCFRSYYTEMPLQFLCYSTDSFTLPQAKNERLLVPYRMWELFLYETKRFNKRWLPLLLWIVKFKRITNVVQAAYNWTIFFWTILNFFVHIIKLFYGVSLIALPRW